MTVRNYQATDYLKIEKLWKKTGIYTVERGDTAGIIKRCNDLGGQFLVMEDPDSDNIIGTSWMTFDGRRVLLHHFAIEPSFQGTGLGRKLALRSVEFAREKQCPMKLEVHQENVAAINLYKSLGFKVFEDYDVYMLLDPAAGTGSPGEQ